MSLYANVNIDNNYSKTAIFMTRNARLKGVIMCYSKNSRLD